MCGRFVLSFLKAEWKVSDTVSVGWASSLIFGSISHAPHLITRKAGQDEKNGGMTSNFEGLDRLTDNILAQINLVIKTIWSDCIYCFSEEFVVQLVFFY